VGHENERAKGRTTWSAAWQNIISFPSSSADQQVNIGNAPLNIGVYVCYKRVMYIYSFMILMSV